MLFVFLPSPLHAAFIYTYMCMEKPHELFLLCSLFQDIFACASLGYLNQYWLFCCSKGLSHQNLDWTFSMAFLVLKSFFQLSFLSTADL